MTPTAAIVAAAFAAFPAPQCGDVNRTLHYGHAADQQLDAAYSPGRAGGMGGGSAPCDIWIRTGLIRRVRVQVAFHEAAHTAGYEHGPAMRRAVNRAVRAYLRGPLNTRTGEGIITRHAAATVVHDVDGLDG